MATHFKPCSVDGCKGNAHWRAHGIGGMCRSHYRRKRDHGDPLGGRARNGEAESFYREVVLPYRGSDCLIWPYARNAGYAVMRRDGKSISVSRSVCRDTHGPAPTDRHEAAHSCGNGAGGCITPMHLSWKTPAENQADKIGHGTSNRGERCAASKLTADDVRRIRSLEGKMTQQQIADEYGVHCVTIGDIFRRATWAWLD